MDLDDRYAQISYWLPGAQKPETLSQVVGKEDYMIPALLAYRGDRDMWLGGREAQKAVEAGEAVPVGNLLSRAVRGESIEAGGETYEGVRLLSLYVKRCLSLLGGAIHAERADMLLFTFEKIEQGTLEMVSSLAGFLGLAPEKVSCQSRAESFFYYNINQPKELWYHQCMICDFTGERLRTLLFVANHHTKPVTVTVKETQHEQVCRTGIRQETPEEAELAARSLDQQFSEVVREACGGRIIDTVYLIGDGFAGNWYQGSLQLLCAGRRVFLGNNLYSKGACYGAQVKCRTAGKSLGGPAGKMTGAAAGTPSLGFFTSKAVTAAEEKKEYVYLGEDMLQVNVGLEVTAGGEAAYFSLLDAGMNWFDARKECDFLLNEDHSFSLRLTPVQGREVKEVIVTLDGVPERPPRTTRIHLSVSCLDERTVKLRMEDKGFGELFPSSFKVWEEIFPIASSVS